MQLPQECEEKHYVTTFRCSRTFRQLVGLRLDELSPIFSAFAVSIDNIQYALVNHA
jgi:hypothetical protein